MPEVTLGPAESANAFTESGDAEYVSGIVINWDATTLRFGRDNAKTPVNRGTVSHYNTSSIPIGAVVSDAKIEVMPSATKTGSFSPTLDVLAIDKRLNQTEQTVHEGSQFIYYPQNVILGVSVWDDSRTSGSDVPLEMPLDIGAGVGSVGQIWTANTTGVSPKTVSVHLWYLQRTAAMSSTTVKTALYNAVLGSSGEYEKGDLIDEGRWRDASSISSSALAVFYTLTTKGIPIVDGEKYISELQFTGGSGSPTIKVGLLTTASGSPDDLMVFARKTPAPARVLQGFARYTQWLSGAKIRTAEVAHGSSDTISGFPNFTSGSKYGLGSSGYDPGTGASYWTTLPNFKQNLQDALNARGSTSDWIGIRVQDFSGTTNNRERVFHSSKGTTETITGYSGMVLTVTYVDPPVQAPGVTGSSSSRSVVLPTAFGDYDRSDQDLFRHSLENSILDISTVASGASDLSFREASMASKRDRTLPKVGIVTIG